MKLNPTSAVALTVGLIALANGALAAPIETTVNDTYWGGQDSQSYGDVISATGDDRFNVEKMVVTQDGSAFKFQIYTNLVGNTDAFSGGGTGQNLTEGAGIGFGDLFLASDWSPGGTGPEYHSDSASTGTLWSHALVLDDHHGAIGQSGSLSLVGLPNVEGPNANKAVLTDELMTGGYFREDQEVLAKDYFGPMATGNWEVFNDYLQMTIDFNNTDLMDTTSLAFHWTMYCGNDVIEGEIDVHSVPEPGMLSLLSLGVAGLWFARRRQRLTA
jgi:hypothetical protein